MTRQQNLSDILTGKETVRVDVARQGTTRLAAASAAAVSDTPRDCSTTYTSGHTPTSKGWVGRDFAVKGEEKWVRALASRCYWVRRGLQTSNPKALRPTSKQEHNTNVSRLTPDPTPPQHTHL